MKTLLMSALMSTTLAVQAAPVLNLFELGIQPGQGAAYDEVGRHNIVTSIAKEPGTLAMYAVRSKDDPDMAWVIEIYADEAAYRKHLQSAQYKAFLQRSPQILTDHKRRIEVVPQFLADKPVKQTADTINNLVIVELAPDQVSAFRDIVLPEMQQSVAKEAGVLAMYAFAEKGSPNRWYFYEIYASDAAYQAHRQTPWFKDYLQRSSALVRNKQAIPITPRLLMNKGGLRFQPKH